MTALAKGCSRLRHCDLTRSSVGNSGAVALLKHCLLLSYLGLNECEHVTEGFADCAGSGATFAKRNGRKLHLELRYTGVGTRAANGLMELTEEVFDIDFEASDQADEDDSYEDEDDDDEDGEEDEEDEEEN